MHNSQTAFAVGTSRPISSLRVSLCLSVVKPDFAVLASRRYSSSTCGAPLPLPLVMIALSWVSTISTVFVRRQIVFFDLATAGVKLRVGFSRLHLGDLKQTVVQLVARPPH